jgi:hypothetical protein
LLTGIFKIVKPCFGTVWEDNSIKTVEIRGGKIIKCLDVFGGNNSDLVNRFSSWEFVDREAFIGWINADVNSINTQAELMKEVKYMGSDLNH